MALCYQKKLRHSLSYRRNLAVLAELRRWPQTGEQSHERARVEQRCKQSTGASAYECRWR